MGARRAFEALGRRWSWIAAAALAGVLAGSLSFALAAPTYRASASVFVSLQSGDSASELVQGSTYTQNQIESFARLATTPAVLDPVISDLGLDVTPGRLAQRVEASAPLDTVIIDIAATDGTAEGSARIANAVAERLSRTVEQLAPQNATGQATVRAVTVSAAEPPVGPASPDLLLDLAVGLLLGLVLGGGAVLAREALDTRVQDPSAVAALTDLPVAGTLGSFPAAGQGGTPVVVESAPHSPWAEAFRQLRTNLQFLEVPEGDGADGRVRTLMVTSSVPDEGKSTVAANLAATLAETGARVLLVDADLRRPSLARLLGLEGAAGLTTVLLGRASVQDVVQDWGSSGLQVLASGAVPPNPSELLGSPAMRRLADQLRDDFDHIVLDAPPLLPVADAAILTHVVDGAFLVVDVQRARREQVRESLQSLEQVHARTLGLVLNRVRRDEATYTYAQETPETATDAATPVPPAPTALASAAGRARP